MNHHEFQELVHDYFRGTLEAEARTEVERHAKTCPSCAEHMQTCQELTCREFVDFLNDYLDHELSDESQAIFDRHLSVCPDCTNYLESYRKTVGLSVAAMKELCSREIPDHLVRAILEARKKL